MLTLGRLLQGKFMSIAMIIQIVAEDSNINGQLNEHFLVHAYKLFVVHVTTVVHTVHPAE